MVNFSKKKSSHLAESGFDPGRWFGEGNQQPHLLTSLPVPGKSVLRIPLFLRFQKTICIKS